MLARTCHATPSTQSGSDKAATPKSDQSLSERDAASKLDCRPSTPRSSLSYLRAAPAVRHRQDVAARISETSRTPSPEISPDHCFLHQTSWAIYSALSKHGMMQGFCVCRGNLEIISPISYMSLPPALRPTPLQLAVSHAYWIDRFPFPRFRDNLIILKGVVDLGDFIQDLFGTVSLTLKAGVPKATWEPEAWTMSTGFSNKWGYLFL
jgi:hypothetical protein